MARLTKKQKEAVAKIEKDKVYSLTEASALVKEITNAKFDASVDLAVRLGVDPRKANQMVRGTVSLPHGTGKDVKVLVLCSPDKEKEATDAGADFAGLDEYIEKIKQGWTDVDKLSSSYRCSMGFLELILLILIYYYLLEYILLILSLFLLFLIHSQIS